MRRRFLPETVMKLQLFIDSRPLAIEIDDVVVGLLAARLELPAGADNEDALSGLAGVYEDLGDATKAADILRTLADKQPSERSLTDLAAAVTDGFGDCLQVLADLFGSGSLFEKRRVQECVV